MTNKYSGLSDFEINKLIADIQGYDYEISNHFPTPPSENQLNYLFINRKITKHEKFWKHIDYCKHYNDAMALMVDNEIGLVKGKNSWFAEDGDRLRIANINPCRAIAECFLLMKDAENNNDK